MIKQISVWISKQPLVPARTRDFLTQRPDNAYVSGLKEDLGFNGNELVQLQTMYTIGAVVGQLPFAFLFTRLPMHWIIPFMDIAWGIFTLVQYRANSYAELAAYRFLVGWFEVCRNLCTGEANEYTGS